MLTKLHGLQEIISKKKATVGSESAQKSWTVDDSHFSKEKVDNSEKVRWEEGRWEK